jgi:phenylpropionate dioxygenase-like ring-hydroxylating dioxygenase large terminal subunit
MIHNQWYIVLESKEVGKKPIGVTRMGEKMVFWREKGGKVHSAVDRCPHRGISLSLGLVVDDHLQCPFHGFEYDNRGLCVHIPANGKGGRIPASLALSTYPTFEAQGFIWIWWGAAPPENLEEPHFFENIDDTFVYSSTPDYWKAHYSRAIENQLDVVHLPFVHQNTIGRGNNTVVDGPLVQWDQDWKLLTYVFNRPDTGIPPKKPNQLSQDDAGSVHLEFIMPNLWQNYISDDVRIVIAFTPVDANNSILYLRFYQRFFRFPFLDKLLTRIAMPSNIFIAHQDRRVVETHNVQPSSYQSDEKLIQGDLPIIEYRKRRDMLKRMANSSHLEDSIKE